MTQTAMEDAIKNLDRRMGAVEQILPTLATKEDLLAAKADLQAEIVATRSHLTGSIEEVTRQSDARFEEAKRHADVCSLRIRGRTSARWPKASPPCPPHSRRTRASSRPSSDGWIDTTRFFRCSSSAALSAWLVAGGW